MFWERVRIFAFVAFQLTILWHRLRVQGAIYLPVFYYWLIQSVGVVRTYFSVVRMVFVRDISFYNFYR